MVTIGSATNTRELVLRGLAAICVIAAVIHFAVAGEHYEDYWAFGVFMLGAAWFQLVWALGAVVRPTRPLLVAGVAVNSAIVAVYLVTRTVGDVIGPDPHDVEPIGFGDLFCTICEAVLVVGMLVALLAPLNRAVPRRRLTAASALAGLTAATLLSVVLVDGGPEMVMSSAASEPATGAVTSDGTGAMSGMGSNHVSSINLPTTSPAGSVTMPDPSMQMEPGMKMLQSSCATAPTPAQQAAAVQLVNATWSADQKYQSLATATAAGFRPVTPTGQPIVHYVNPANYRATAKGGPALDPDAPQSLVYANTPAGAVLVAAMYMATKAQGTPPSPGGCLTQWHVHTNLCLGAGKGVVALADPTCPAGSTNRVTPPMLHVWFVPIPGGPTAVDATDAQIVRAAEGVASPKNPKA
jgi:hypothetical protein